MNLTDLKEAWRNDAYVNKGIHDRFKALVEADGELNAHRQWVESHIFGFGEKAFHWLHKIVVDEMPESFSFLEIGGFRMQVVTLYALLARRSNRTVSRFCVSPMNTTNVGGVPFWESDYFSDSISIHSAFSLVNDYKLFHGLSTDPEIFAAAAMSSPYDVVYIDGGHDYPTVKADMQNYTQLVKPGGYLIVDDCSNNLKMWPGCFPGIYSVSKAVDEFMSTQNDFEHLGAVMHNRIWKRKA